MDFRSFLKRCFLFGFLVSCAKADLSSINSICCEEGALWSSTEDRCDNYPSTVSGVSVKDQPLCRSILEVCCLKSKQEQMCAKGKTDALEEYGMCTVRDYELGAVTYKECCLCCQMGKAARQMGMPCDAPEIGNPCDLKFIECCTGIIDDQDSSAANDTSNPVTDLDECSVFGDGQLCSQICINTIGSFRCACNPGYELAQDGRTCYRRAERLRLCSDGNNCTYQCVDSPRGPVCKCQDGYQLQRDGISCEDVDECQQRVCQPGSECINLQGSYQCRKLDTPTCRQGYVYDSLRDTCVPQRNECRPGFAYNTLSQRCEDIDECIVRTHNCFGQNEMCTNTYGTFYCHCEDGFYRNRTTNFCEDIDECARQMDDCTASQRCENTIGSFACRRITPCGTGWTLNEETQECSDQNECELGTHNCGTGYECFNIEGSFRCNPKTCAPGFRVSPTTGQCERINCPRGFRADAGSLCVDINECERPNICRQFQNCINTQGSYRCVDTVACGPGYELGANGITCEDIDECATNQHDCQGGATCINRRGSYFCSCGEGYRRINGACVDKNECSYGNFCPFNARCENTVGSFRCICNPGLEQRGNQCIDVDECLQPNICQHRCVNLVGSYQCACNLGFQLAADDRTCEDINECQQYGGRGRLCGGQCINTPGSYECTCPDGWQVLGNGRSCQDVDECETNPTICGAREDTMCFNTRGSFKCPRITCPPNFSRSELGPKRNSVRCKRLSFTCRQGDQECLNAPLSLSYNFLTFPTNVKVPTDLFSMSGPKTLEKTFSWYLNVTSVSPLHGVQPVTRDDFDLRIGRSDAVVSLRRRIDGGQDIELMLTMEITDRYSGYTGHAHSKIYLYVTPQNIA